MNEFHYGASQVDQPGGGVRSHLRPEAWSALYADLDSAQQDAFEKVLRLVSEAAGDLPPPTQEPADGGGGRDWFGQGRSSRMVFLSGTRGTGKTTVLMSIKKELSRFNREAGITREWYKPALVKDLEREYFVSPSVELQDKLSREKDRVGQKTEAIYDLVKDVSKRIVWLEPLEMESMPEAANLLASILARVENAVWQSGMSEYSRGSAPNYSSHNLFEPSPGYHHALMELQSLQADVALAWEGNLPERSGHLDPDVFALEVMRAERARLNLTPRLSQVLESLAANLEQLRTFENPVFLLCVDDFDINPTVCLPLLRLLRLISVPRLFIIVLGDIDVATVVLNLKVSGDLARAARPDRSPDGPASILSIPVAEVANVAGEVAFNALRKLVPPAQRVRLEPLTPHEGLNFRPLGLEHHEKREMVHDLLGCLPFTIDMLRKQQEVASGKRKRLVKNDPLVAGIRLESVRDFLLVKRFTVLGAQRAARSEPTAEAQVRMVTAARRITSEDLSIRPYRAVEFLRAPLRRLTDLWFQLSDLVDSEPEASHARRGLRGLRQDLPHDNQETNEPASRASVDIDTTPPLSDGVIEFFGRHCRRALEEDPALAALDRRLLPLAISTSANREADFTLLPIKVQSVKIHAKKITTIWKEVYRAGADHELIEVNHDEELGETKTDDIWARLNIGGHRYWRFYRSHEILPSPDSRRSGNAGDKAENGEFEKLLSGEAAASLMLYHDLSVLNSSEAPPDLGSFSPSTKYGKEQEWAYIEWRTSSSFLQPKCIYWPLPTWESFWEFDLFLEAWNEVLGRVPPTSVRAPERDLIDRLAFFWLSAATAIVGGSEPVRPSDVGGPRSPKGAEDWWFNPVPEEDWKNLLKTIGVLAQENTRDTPRGQRIRDWVTRVALFTFSELGLSSRTRAMLWEAAEQSAVSRRKDAGLERLFGLWRDEQAWLYGIRDDLRGSLDSKISDWLDTYADAGEKALERQRALMLRPKERKQTER